MAFMTEPSIMKANLAMALAYGSACSDPLIPEAPETDPYSMRRFQVIRRISAAEAVAPASVLIYDHRSNDGVLV